MTAHTRIAPRRAALPLTLLVLVLSFVAFTPGARAISAEEHLTTFGNFGTGAGEMRFPSGVAASPLDGHIFVVDNGNKRIDEFTSWGEFVKAFGWDVAPGGVNEQQQVTVKASAGQFRLSFKGDTTSDIAHDASAGEVQAALEALGSIGAAGVTVTKGPSDAASSRFLIAFSGESLKEEDQEALGAEPGTVPLSGGSPSSGVAVTTVADGNLPTTELESCTAESGCQPGSFGTGAGQIGFARIAIDSSGDIYVQEYEPAYRVQKFDPAGHFLLMFGGEVDKTTKADVCTAASHDECGAGVRGTAPGWFTAASGIAIGPDSKIVAGDKERVEEFEPDGTFLQEVSLAGGLAAGETLEEVVVDPLSGALFARHAPFFPYPNQRHVAKFSAAGAPLCEFPVSTIEQNGPGSIAVDPSGHLYVVRETSATSAILEFGGGCPASKLSEFTLDSLNFPVVTLGTNSIGDLFVSRIDQKKAEVEIYGPPPVQFEPPLPAPPSIAGQYAVGVDPQDATLRAEINPHFWTDTRYYVEYGTGKCSEGGCTLTGPLPPGALLSKTAKGSPVTSGDVVLDGLQPGTAYHYRFVAQSTGGGPVRGVGGTPGADGAEGTFRTPALPDSSPQGCANEGLRSGGAASLPDCRAYEMVSPVEKDGADIRDLNTLSDFSAAFYQAAQDGESIAYSSYRPFAGAPAGGFSLQYIAKRSTSGWETKSISPPHGGESPFAVQLLVDREFQAFTPDLCTGWLLDSYPPFLAPGAVEGIPNLYRRDNCSASPTYEALTTTAPLEHLDKASEVQGFSSSGSTSVYRMPLNHIYTVYERTGGVESPVCVLPDETVLSTGCSAGSNSNDFYFFRGASLSHAVSEDGSRIYWTAANVGPGKIYLRLEGASTVPVSETQTKSRSAFLGASADGSKALFMPEEGTKAKNLYLYSLEGEESTSTKLAGEVIGVAGTSEDLSSVYFVSKEAIAGSGQNVRGAEAQAGQPNLYLEHEGTVSFITTLGAGDVRLESSLGAVGVFYSDVEINPLYHVASATPDGGHLVFMSSRPITGYDNVDPARGEADSEVFQYSAATGELACPSCQPSGARPHGRLVAAPVGGASPLAALLPGALSALHSPRTQSVDGAKVFFTAYDALVPRDTNGVADVYEWERPGAGKCNEESPAFSPANGGCVYLISSGTSASDSELIEASPDGRDVFFLTNQSLLPQDPGLIDIYDARAEGGFPPSPSPAAGCEGEACQGAYAPPNDPTPSSSTFSGAGNVKEAPSSQRKKKHKKKQSKHAAKKHPKRAAKKGTSR